MYDFVWSFTNGLAPVEKHGKRGFVDKTGKEVVVLKYDDVDDFRGGFAGVKKDGKWGVVDKTGKEIIEPIISGDKDSPLFDLLRSPLKSFGDKSFVSGLAKKLKNMFGSEILNTDNEDLIEKMVKSASVVDTIIVTKTAEYNKKIADERNRGEIEGIRTFALAELENIFDSSKKSDEEIK